MTVESGSFRDPSGQVFFYKNGVYRSVFAPGINDYEAGKKNGIYEELFQKGYLIRHEEVDVDIAPQGTRYCLKYPRLPMVSYPWEWCFSLLKDAAILHLDMMEFLLPKGFWLRDASAFNVQYDGSGVRFIDTLSLGKKPMDSPWVAYKQFCSHFLAPLATAAHCDIRTFGLWRNYIDGFPLDLSVNMLPPLKKYNPRLFMHLTLHSRFQENADKQEDLKKTRPRKKQKVSDVSLLGIIRSLRKSINQLKWKAGSKIWANYGAIRTYENRDVTEKATYVREIINRLNPQMVWDLGGNKGEYSLIAAEKGAFVVSIDGDPACSEYIYREITSTEKGRRVLPLTMDLANPSPGLGWENQERSDLTERGPADLVLALALVHHLVFSANVPFSLIARWFARLTDHLLVEFVPPGDPMVKKLTENRPEHLPYSEEEFKFGFGTYFEFVGDRQLDNGRILFHCRKRSR